MSNRARIILYIFVILSFLYSFFVEPPLAKIFPPPSGDYSCPKPTQDADDN